MPPPPPICFPFSSNKPRCRLSWSSSDRSWSPMPLLHPKPKTQIVRHPSYSAALTATSHADSLTFHSNLEIYEDVHNLVLRQNSKNNKGRLGRSNTMTGPRKPTAPSK